SIDVDGYHITWDNIQIAANRGGFQFLINANGGATIDGAELTLNARPTDSLNLVAAVTYQDARMNQADTDLAARKHERLPNSARFAATLDADYQLPFSRELSPYLGATIRYIGDRHASFDANVNYPQYDLPEYTTLDVRTGLTLGTVDAQLYVHNVTDERGQL